MNNFFRTLLVLPFFIFFLSNTSQAQLDSVNVTASFESESVIIDGVTMSINDISVETWVNDFDFLGSIAISVFNTDDESLIDLKKYTKAQLLAENLFSNGTITTKVVNVDSSASYRIEVGITNYQGLYLAPQEFVLTAN
jgi:hypothetical protein